MNFYLSFLCKLQLLGSVVSVSPVLCAEQEEYLSRKYVLIILGSPGVTQSPQSYLGSVSIFAARPLPLSAQCTLFSNHELSVFAKLYFLKGNILIIECSKHVSIVP